MAKLSNNEILVWRERVEACEASNLSTIGWCKENSINPSTLQYWVKKFKRQSVSSKSQWAEIKLQPIEASNIEESIILRYHDFIMEIPKNFTKSTLAEIISAIKSIC